MSDEKRVPRLTESLSGRMAGWLLVALWLFSMSGVDPHAFSSYPVCLGLGAVLVMVAWGMLRGYRLVRMGWLGWCSLAAGGYFLVRCLCSYAVVDSWCETALILGAVVYYVAGVYAAQLPRPGVLLVVLAVALLANVAAFWLVDMPGFELAWTGRAAFTPEGTNSVPTTLFIYKNFAGVFLCVGGCVLGAWSALQSRGVWRVVGLLVALVSVFLSFQCGTRAVYLLLPLALVGIWLLQLLVRLCSHARIGLVNFLVGGALLVGVALLLYDFLFGYGIVSILNNTDSHLRYLMWRSICEVLPDVPVYGCGANATTWEIIPWYNEWTLPNYAHNEYLQVWVDYGVVGLLLMLGILLIHVVQGVRCMVSEQVDSPRRVLAGLAVLCLGLLAVYAIADFPWHSFTLLTLSSFACGVLASPFVYTRTSWFSGRSWAAGSHAPVVPVRAQKWSGRLLLFGGLLAVLGVASWLGMILRPAWKAQWEYEKLCLPGADVSGDARRAFIANLLPMYPSPALMDTYFMLPPTYNQQLPLREKLLKQVLAANPRQLFTVTMLADVLGAQQKFAEADRLMREYYVGDSMPASSLNNWPAYYAYNLLMWGNHEMQQGNHGLALSLLTDAIAIDKVNRVHFNVPWRGGPQPWKEHGGIKPWLRPFIRNCEVDLRMLRAIGVRPDDSWKQPYTPGGKPALYRSLLHKTQK